MEISRHGPRCFQFKSSDLVVLTDPNEDQASLADVIIWSSNDQEVLEAISDKAQKRLIRGPGEYEISSVFIHGVRTYRDAQKGAVRGFNTSYTVSMDNVKVCYLGHIGHSPTSDHASSLGDVDVLLLPVGDDEFDTAAMAETIGILEPRLILPVGDSTQSQLEALAKELGVALQPPTAKLSVSHSSLPPEPQVAILSSNDPD